MLLSFLAITAFYIIRLRHLFAVVMLSGVFSLLSASLLVMLDAVDVAFTEASVGAGISTVLMLGTLALTRRREKIPEHTKLVPLAVVLITGGALIYGTLDMPYFGDPNAPAHGEVMDYYIAGSETDIGVPNVVTSVLASYRGFDTLGETAVVFTAGIGVLILLTGLGSGAYRREEEDEERIAETPVILPEEEPSA